MVKDGALRERDLRLSLARVMGPRLARTMGPGDGHRGPEDDADWAEDHHVSVVFDESERDDLVQDPGGRR
jgi:hypothetical protein